MLAKAFALSPCCEAGPDDTNHIDLPFCVNNDRDAAMNLANRDESVLILLVRDIENLQVILPLLKELYGLGEGQAMLAPVASILRVVSLESHVLKYKPMA
jgi:hypothetical protein